LVSAFNNEGWGPDSLMNGEEKLHLSSINDILYLIGFTGQSFRRHMGFEID